MKFDIERKGYNREEVDEYVFALKNEYENKLSEQKNRIFSLKARLTEAEKELEGYRARVDAVAAALIAATEKAEELEKLALARYREEVAELRAFHERWQARYNRLIEKYPDDAELKAESTFNEAMEDILSGEDASIEQLEAHLEDEKERLRKRGSKTLAEDAVSPNGFSFEEAWNPKQELGDIMKELGLLSEDE